MEIKTRKQAATAGEKKYYTGRPCINGHDGPRYTATGICCKCNSEGVKRYNKNMRKSVGDHRAGAFSYPLHPDDHAAALAYCQALDLQRGRAPSPSVAISTGTPLALPADIARHRQTLLASLSQPAVEPYLPKP